MEETNSQASPFVAILVNNWNRKNDLLNLFTALQKLDYDRDRYKILLVDNASTDGSVEAVREQFPNVAILQNTENLGSTGGFNSGLRYILQGTLGEFDYIWLLDNDALVEPAALKELVKIAEMDPCIGLVGSRIMNPDAPDNIVEVGVDMGWRHGTVLPNLRNIPDSADLKDYYDVVAVAGCSSMARVAAIRKVGLMDERCFVYWDDMEWGISFTRHGYRVVGATRSVVYHRSFSERRVWSPANVYYETRNRLLVFSKHSVKLDRIIALYRIVRSAMKKNVSLWISGRKKMAKLQMLSIVDFIRNKWGRYTYDNSLPNKDNNYIKNFSQYKRFIVIPSGDAASFEKTLEEIRRQSKDAYVCLLVTINRVNLFSDVKVDEKIVLDYTQKNAYLKTFITLLWKKFDIAVVPPHGALGTFNHISYAVKKTCVLDDEKNLFRLDQPGGMLWKLPLSIVLGELSSWLIFPVILLTSFRYRSKIIRKPCSSLVPSNKE
ncbi:MAG: glycosyltransferase family 2 protein [Nitrospirae bacterium]|nr:glycosyltransferase family 2 protein [Nitrospirota bacterium]